MTDKADPGKMPEAFKRAARPHIGHASSPSSLQFHWEQELGIGWRASTAHSAAEIERLKAENERLAAPFMGGGCVVYMANHLRRDGMELPSFIANQLATALSLIEAANAPADPVTFDENWTQRDHDDKMAHNAESAPEDEGDD